jgi:surface polysaccharide O-acyltransferase-like enzyme
MRESINNKNNIQNYAINLCKIIACFLVIINHTSLYILDYGHQKYFLFYCIEFVLCRIAVPIFIMCTGFLLCQKKINFKYLSYKILKILFLILIFSGVIYFAQNPILNLKNFLQFFNVILVNPIVEPYWYLYMLLGLYLMIPLINKMISNFELKEYLYSLLIILIIPSIFILFNIDLSNYFLMNFLNYTIGYYIAGSFLKYLSNREIYFKLKEWYFFLPFLVINICLIVFIYFKSINTGTIFNSFLNSNSLFVILNSILLMFLILIHYRTKLSSLVLSKLSSLTLGIYLLHPILQNKIFKLGVVQNIFAIQPILGIIFLQILIFVCCAVLTFLFKSIAKHILTLLRVN